MAQVDNLAYVSWFREILPDVLWIALLIDRFGPERGIELALGLVEAAETVRPPIDDANENQPWGWTPLLADCYTALSPEDRQRIIDCLDAQTRADLQDALLPLAGMYSEFPMTFLVDEAWRRTQRVDPDEALATLSRVIQEAADRRKKPATWIQGACVYCAEVTGRLRMTADSSLYQNFNAIERYPETEESIKIASLVRATTNMMLSGSST